MKIMNVPLFPSMKKTAHPDPEKNRFSYKIELEILGQKSKIVTKIDSFQFSLSTFFPLSLLKSFVYFFGFFGMQQYKQETKNINKKINTLYFTVTKIF